jgi:hypothetical protein
VHFAAIILHVASRGVVVVVDYFIIDSVQKRLDTSSYLHFTEKESITVFFFYPQVSIPSLERALHQYTINPSDVPFDMKSVPLAAVASSEEIVNPSGKGGQADGMLISAALPGNGHVQVQLIRSHASCKKQGFCHCCCHKLCL